MLFILLGFRFGCTGGQVACEFVSGFYSDGGEALGLREGGWSRAEHTATPVGLADFFPFLSGRLQGPSGHSNMSGKLRTVCRGVGESSWVSEGRCSSLIWGGGGGSGDASGKGFVLSIVDIYFHRLCSLKNLGGEKARNQIVAQGRCVAGVHWVPRKSEALFSSRSLFSAHWRAETSQALQRAVPACPLSPVVLSRGAAGGGIFSHLWGAPQTPAALGPSLQLPGLPPLSEQVDTWGPAFLSPLLI